MPRRRFLPISVTDGTLTGELCIEIDFKRLAQLLGLRALRAKSKRTTLAGGAIVAYVLNPRRRGAK